MTDKLRRLVLSAVLAAVPLGWASGPASAHELVAKAGNAQPSFDVVRARVTANEKWLTFRMQVSAEAGAVRPVSTGKAAGSEVFAYVWPTNLDSATVGFEAEQGILALVVTAHPDFDDTPLYDENGDGDLDNDGNVWHSHWVVLVSDDACGPGALKVKDIPEGTTPKLPPTWPGFPILLDSPGFSPVIGDETVTVRVPAREVGAPAAVSFDAVTAGLRVNANVHAPLLCVVDVFDVASGDLSLPGKVEQAEAPQ